MTEVAAKVIGLGRPQTPQLMRLPADLSGKPLLSGSAHDVSADAGYPGAPVVPVLGGAAPASGPLPSGDRAWDEWCLHFFEAGAAEWRRRLGR